MEEVVRLNFDRVAEKYLASRDRLADRRYLDRFLEHVAAGALVLDLGCGAGLPVDEYLIANGRRVVGVDISEKQIELARKKVPEARFEVGDMSTLAPGEYQVDGIVSLYAIFHTPRERHQELLCTLNSFLPLDGWLLITMGAGEWEGVEHDFHGGSMVWSHYGHEKNRKLLEHAGFEAVLDEIDRQATESHQFLLGRKVDVPGPGVS